MLGSGAPSASGRIQPMASPWCLSALNCPSTSLGGVSRPAGVTRSSRHSRSGTKDGRRRGEAAFLVRFAALIRAAFRQGRSMDFLLVRGPQPLPQAQAELLAVLPVDLAVAVVVEVRQEPLRATHRAEGAVEQGRI